MKKNLAPILTMIAVLAIIVFVVLAVGSAKTPTNDGAVRDKLISYAGDVGLNKETFKKDIDSSETAQIIQKDADLAAALSLPGTPSFFVNGVYVDTKAPADLTSAIDRALAGQEPVTSPSTTVKPTDAQKAEIAVGQTKGNTSSTVTVTEFGDFECPACKAYETDLRTTVLPIYLDKIRFVFKNFPLVSIHPNALIGAKAAAAAAKQGKFWQYHDVLYDKQDDWAK